LAAFAPVSFLVQLSSDFLQQRFPFGHRGLPLGRLAFDFQPRGFNRLMP
jgi:hypothetical protein